jgi:ferredoxin
MCEYCHLHGEGKKWYLNAKNYSDDLLSDLDRRKLLGRFFHEMIGDRQQSITRMEQIVKKNKKLPAALIKSSVDQSKKMHFGQILPKEEVCNVFKIASNIVRVPCGCYYAATGKENRRCFMISINPSGFIKELDFDYFGNIDTAGFETVAVNQATKYIDQYDNQGLIHTIWTFMTPFIGGICNCDMDKCLASRSTFGLDMPVMFKSEYVSEINADLCTCCGECAKICPVHAIKFNEPDKTFVVDKTGCSGCGICRTVCEQTAIKLIDRPY